MLDPQLATPLCPSSKTTPLQRQSKLWRYGALTLVLVPLVYLAVAREDHPLFEDEAAFVAAFAALEDGPLRTGEASLGESPRNDFTLLYPPGQYQIQTTNTSILTLTGQSAAVKKRKEYWFHLLVSEPDSAGRSTYHLKQL